MKGFPLQKAIIAGLIVGTLDILAAFIQFYINTSKNPVIVLQFIASAVFGKQAYTGGTSMIIAGLLFHFIIAICFSVFFFWLVNKIPGILQQRILAGILYGLFIYAVMNFLVVPLTHTAKFPFNPIKAIIAAGILIVCIGIPLALMAGRKTKAG